MKRFSPPLILIVLVTLGSGLLNVYSVIGRGLPERVSTLREIFPLEFIHLSRSATLLIGFALVVSALNVLKRKRVAYWSVLSLASFSVVFHLTKGVDYEEALLSAALIVLLTLNRKRFTVRSRPLPWRGVAERLAVVLALAVAYGIAGFWFLEPREFGIDFNLWDSVIRTFRFLSLQGDPTLAPRTHFAGWFLDSLYLVTSTTFIYAGFALFRPVFYQLRTHPHEMEIARRIVGQFGRSSQDFFKTRSDKSYFISPEQDAFLAYRVGWNFAVVLGDPVGPESAILDLVKNFSAFCSDNDWRFGFHQALSDFLPVYESLGLKKLKIGDDAIVDLQAFTLEGKTAKTIRSKVNQLEKSGVTARFFEAPLTDDVLAEATEISEEWLQIPGRRERQFTLGSFEPDYVRSTPLFAALDGSGRMLGFVNIIPSYRKDETTIDLMRRRTEAPNGIMDYVFIKLFLKSREEGFTRFNLGMSPMAGFQEFEEASPEERAVHAFFQHLNFLFSFKGLHAYKAKFANIWEPRYVVYKSVLDLPRLALALGRVSALEE